MQPRTLSRTNLSTQLYESLRAGLMDGQFRPGERLTIAAIARAHGTSITPVREAISRLASERALEVRASTSVMVPRLTPDHLREILAIRRALEGMAAERLAARATPAAIGELAEINAAFISAAGSDPAAAARLNRDFHFRVLALAEMPYVHAICESMWTLMGPFLRDLHEAIPVRRLTEGNHLHFTLLAALRAGDATAARAAMEADLGWSLVLLEAQEAEARARA